MTIELNENLEHEVKELSKKNNCTVGEMLDSIINEYLDQLYDRRLIEETEAYEKEHGARYFTSDKANEIIEKIDNGELTEEDIDKL